MKNSLIALCCALCFVFAACGEPTSDQAPLVSPQEISETPVPESERNLFGESSTEESQNTFAGADLIAGNWECIGIYYEDELVLFVDVPDLADLYDQTLTFYGDGTYIIYDVPYGAKGTWFKSDNQVFSDYKNAYIITEEYTTFTRLVDGSITSTETESKGTAIIACIQEDAPEYLVWLESDSDDVKILVYKKEGSESAVVPNRDYSTQSSKPGSDISPSYSAGTMGEKNALEKAESYLNSSAFSYDGLVEQLEFEGFSHSEAVYGADHCGADWKEQALKKALSYLRSSSFSESGLIEQLEFEGFTSTEAQYGVDNCGADWNEQAAKKAASYLSHSSFSRSDLIDQLEFEGFTYSQAVYA